MAIGQILYAQEVEGRAIGTSQLLYANPWVDSFARLLAPLVKTAFQSRAHLDQDFISGAASECALILSKFHK